MKFLIRTNLGPRKRVYLQCENRDLKKKKKTKLADRNKVVGRAVPMIYEARAETLTVMRKTYNFDLNDVAGERFEPF